MRTKSVSLALLLAATALSVQAQTAEPAAERAARTPAAISALDRVVGEHPARQPRTDKAPTVGVGSAFSVFTYDAIGATPRVQPGRRHTAPDATDAKTVAVR